MKKIPPFDIGALIDMETAPWPDEEYDKPIPYDRVAQWGKFSEQVAKHITEYTLKSYGNTGGNEQVDSFTVEDCYTNMMRYINRRNARVRGNKEALRDVIKIAHYASFIYDKLKEEMKDGDVY